MNFSFYDFNLPDFHQQIITVYSRSIATIVSSNPAQTMDTCLCVFVVTCRYRTCEGLISYSGTPVIFMLKRIDIRITEVHRPLWSEALLKRRHESNVQEMREICSTQFER